MKHWHHVFLSTFLNSPQLWEENKIYDRLLILFFFVLAAIKKIYQKRVEGFGGDWNTPLSGLTWLPPPVFFSLFWFNHFKLTQSFCLLSYLGISISEFMSRIWVKWKKVD